MDNLPVSLGGTRPGAGPVAVRILQRQAVTLAANEGRSGAPPQLPAAAARDGDESTFLELRRKVQSGELLSASTERLLRMMKFNGHLTVVVQHGTVVKSGYEEGYFRRRHDLGGALLRG